MAQSAVDLALQPAAYPRARGTALSEVELLAPMPRPGKLICIGRNYRRPSFEGGNPIPDYPPMLFEPPTSLTDPATEMIQSASGGERPPEPSGEPIMHA